MPQPINNIQPSLAITQYVATSGVFPSPNGGYDFTMGMIRMFAGNFDPGDDLIAAGQALSIINNQALFSLYGTTYGGNGQTTFALPNLVGRAVTHAGQGPGLPSYTQGQTFGANSFNLSQSNLPGAYGGTSQALDNEQASLTTQYLIRVEGVFQGGPGACSIGAIVQFGGNFTPGGYLPCDGRLLPIAQNQALFAILGTTYGGNGQTTFALPDLRGRVAVGAGQGPGLANVALGEMYGGDTSITNANMPTNMGGLGQPISNQAPSLGLNYLIALQGVFPTRDGGGSPDDEHLVGEIILFAGNTIPNGWARCEGQLLSIAQNTALFSLLGTQYGGNGQTTFALPDFRGRTALGADGVTIAPGTYSGSPTYTLTSADIPSLTINGTAASESLYGGDDPDQLSGNGGDDTLTGNGGADRLSGGDGGDTLHGGGGDDILLGGAGADTLNGDGGFDAADYGVSSAGVTVNLAMGTGTGGDAQGDTLSGIESVTGSGLADVLTAAATGSRLFGGGGDDTLTGGVGADVLSAGAGLDTVNGGDGDDRIDFGAGDVISGGAGYDTGYVVDGARTVINLEAAGMEMLIDQAGGNDWFEGTQRSVSVTVYAGAGADLVQGGSANDVLWGEGGDDIIVGGVGADVLNGGAGADVMNGGDGRDQLYGGAADGASDRFRFTVSGAASWDYVAQFELGVDKLDVSALTASFGNVLITTAGADSIVSVNGQQVCVVRNTLGLTASDFILGAAPAPAGAVQKPDIPWVQPGVDPVTDWTEAGVLDLSDRPAWAHSHAMTGWFSVLV